jgi:RsiW-degrading membrane proteinase PrsW (M82 family)
MLYILFICSAVPMTLMLFLLDKKPRTTVLYMLIGQIMCLLAAQMNYLLRDLIYAGEQDMFAVTVTVTPIVEEILKAIPVIYFGFVISHKKENLLNVAMALGIGFAILENFYILTVDTAHVSIAWAFVRGFSAALLHGVCTSLVGYGVSYVKTRKKLFYTGTFALLAMAIILHGLYNAFIQSEYAYVGVALPIAIYIPIVLTRIKNARTKK